MSVLVSPRYYSTKFLSSPFTQHISPLFTQQRKISPLFTATPLTPPSTSHRRHHKLTTARNFGESPSFSLNRRRYSSNLPNKSRSLTPKTQIAVPSLARSLSLFTSTRSNRPLTTSRDCNNPPKTGTHQKNSRTLQKKKMRTKEMAQKNAQDHDVGENQRGLGKKQPLKKKKNKSPASGEKNKSLVKENEASISLPPVKEKKSLVKKRKQVDEGGAEVEAVKVNQVKVNQPQKKQRKRKDLDFIIQCQANGLCEIASVLKHAHEEDVKVVGFGGMLCISGISVTKTKLIRWLVERFNGRSQMLEIDDMNRFVVTAGNICDVNYP